MSDGAGAHRAHIHRALQFMARHLEEPITVADVARAAHPSAFHFQRVFHAEVGEAPAHAGTMARAVRPPSPCRALRTGAAAT